MLHGFDPDTSAIPTHEKIMAGILGEWRGRTTGGKYKIDYETTPYTLNRDCIRRGQRVHLISIRGKIQLQ